MHTQALPLWSEQAQRSLWQTEPREAFLHWIGSQTVYGHPFRERSCLVYRAMFQVWCRFLQDRAIDVGGASAQHAREFFEQARLDPVSQRRYLQLLDRLYAHLQSKGACKANPMRDMFLLERALPERAPQGLTDEQLGRLVQHLLGIAGWKGHRDRAIVALAVGAGLRTHELLALRPEDIRLGPEQWQIRVRSDGLHAEHTCEGLPPWYEAHWLKWLHAWDLEQRERFGSNGWWLPSTAKGTQYGAAGLFRRVRCWFEKAQIGAPSQGATILRNTFVRLALQADWSFEDIQANMGHVHARATSRHVQAAREQRAALT